MHLCSKSNEETLKCKEETAQMYERIVEKTPKAMLHVEVDTCTW